MKTTLRIALIFCLSAGLFAFPYNVLADDGQPGDPPAAPEGVQAIPVVEDPNSAGQEDIDPVADAQQAPFFTYTKTLVGLDFHPSDSDMAFSSTNGGLYATSLVPGWGFYAPLNLPDGASVTDITFFVVDNNASLNIALGAYSFDPASNTPSTITTTSSAGASAGIRSLPFTTGLPFTVNSGTYAYRLRVEFSAAGETQMLYGARITYNVPLVIMPGPISDEYITLAGADFRSSSANMTYSAQGGSLYATHVVSSHYFYSRLELPDGARVNRVEWYVVDNDDNDYFNVRVYSHTLAVNSFGVEESDTTSGLTSSSSIRMLYNTGSPLFTMDNKTNAYMVGFSPSASATDFNLRIIGARVRYTPPSTSTSPVTKSYSGIQFQPSGSTLTYQALGAKLFPLALSGNRSFQASLSLPSNVRIGKITFYVIDNSGEDLTLTGRFYYPQTGGYADPLTGSSAGLPSSANVQAIAYSGIAGQMGVMDASTDVARLRVSPGSAVYNEMYLVGAQVEYFFPKKTFLPAIRR